MKWVIIYTRHAQKDLKKLDNTQKMQVLKAIEKVSENPLPKSKGGYGKPLGNHNESNLSGFLKIKLRKTGLRIIYKLEFSDNMMKIIIISARSGDEVYTKAQERIKRDED